MNLSNKKRKIITKLSSMGTFITLLAIKSNMCFAANSGGVLIFASIVVAAIKMIANANNPQKRAESIGSLAWICGGGVILGASLIIAGIIINVATNNTGNLLGG